MVSPSRGERMTRNHTECVFGAAGVERSDVFRARARLCITVFAFVVMISSAALVLPLSSSPVSAAGPIVMNIGTVLAPDNSFNPFSITTGISYMIQWFAFERLTASDPVTLGVTPMLAESWETSPDGKVWTYHLANSIWHDNVSVTADDVVFTFKLIIDNPGECALYGSYLQNVTEVVALDAHTVRITTEVPKATMLTMAVPIIPKHLWSSVPLGSISQVDPWNTKYFPNGPIGSGPMILKSYDRTRGEVLLLKWDKYHINTIKEDEILIKIFPDENGMVTALTSGGMDLAMYVPQTAWDATLANPDIDGQVAKQMDMHQLGFNCAPASIRFATDSHGNPLFRQASQNTETLNLAVRQAVAMAINKTQILSEVLKNLAEKGDSIIPPMTPYWHYYVPSSEEWKFDLQKANETLEAAGYVDNDHDGIRENTTSGAELKFKFYYISGILADQLAADMIYTWLGWIGISAVPNNVQESTLYGIWVGMEYDMFIWNWQPDIDPSFMLSVLTTSEIPVDSHDMAAWSDSFYSNPVYDNLFVQQQNTVDPSQRQTIVREMQRMVYIDCPYVVMWYPYGLYAYRTDKFTNYPDFQAQPGATPDTIWYYFQVIPKGAANLPPGNVNAGPDQLVYQGETVSFTGSATDPNDALEDLTWSWVVEDPDHTLHTLAGMTVEYTFNQLGISNVTLTVTDPGGLKGTDKAVITIEPVPINAGWIVGYVNSSTDGAVVGALVTGGGLSRTTDDQGFYNLTLIPGTYVVNASATGYSTATDSATVTAHQKSWLNLTITLMTWTLKGQVIDADTHVGIAGVNVSLLISGALHRSVTTNVTGYYELLHIQFGTFDVNASESGYKSNETTLTITAPTVKVLDIELAKIAPSKGKGLSTAMIAATVAAVVIVAAVAVTWALKKRKPEEPPPA